MAEIMSSPSSNGQPTLAGQTSLIDGGVQAFPPPQDIPVGRSNAPTLEKWSRTPRPRGRQAKDPMGIEVRYQCASIENMEAQLQGYIANPTSPAEHTTLEFTFPTSAAFMITTSSSSAAKDTGKANTAVFSPFSRTAISVVDALSQVDPKEQLRKQKAIAKAIVDSISGVDGYRYSFHNSWVSKEDDALRFSYFCNDSTLNKGRAANEGAGMAGKKKVKPVYDCKGVIHIKFSATKHVLEVHYRHVPLHQTYEARAPPPRKGSKRRKIMELFTPEKLPKHSNNNNNARPRPLNQPSESTDLRSRRSRRPTDPSSDATGDDALAPLIDFLGSTQQQGDDQALQVNANPQPAPAVSELPVYPSERVDRTRSQSGRDKRPRPLLRPPSIANQGRPKPSRIPGTMAGYLVGNDLEIEWAFNQDKPAQRAVNANPPPGALQGIAGSASASASASASVSAAVPAVANESVSLPGGPASELDILKQKLLEAEKRIKRLEAEKQRAMGPPGWPPPAPPQSNNNAAAAQRFTYPFQSFGQPPPPHRRPHQQLPQAYPASTQFSYSQQPAGGPGVQRPGVATLAYFVDQTRHAPPPPPPPAGHPHPSTSRAATRAE